MALSGLKDGAAVITATHANTGMSDSVTVNVNTLRNELYMFQMYPNVKTTLSYTNGNSQAKQVETNATGAIVLYEPSGIASDILLKADTVEGVYLGTIYKATLVSGERDATKLALYPMNSAHMRLTAKAEIFLKKPDGTPFTGNIVLRGGVYKNDAYCEDAKIGITTGNLRDGKTPTSVTIGSDGKLTVYMDSTQFWSSELGESGGDFELTSADNLRYIFEVTEIGSYKPLLLLIDGNMNPQQIVRSAESVVALENANGAQPFAAVQVIDYGLSNGRLLNVRDTSGEIGPNAAYPSAELVTIMFLWGQTLSVTGYHLDIADEFGCIPPTQASEEFVYPFSSIPLVRNTLVLSEDSITASGWIAPASAKGIRTRLSFDGAVVSDVPLGFKVCDMNTFPNIKNDADVKAILINLKSGSALPDIENNDLPDDKFVKGALSFMSGIDGGIGGSNFKMIVTPTESQTVFKAIIWAGSDGIGLEDEDYDEAGFNFNDDYLEGDTSENYLDVTSFKDLQNPQTYKDVSGSSDMAAQLEGYFEAEIRYNFSIGKWEIYTTGGGFTAGFKMGYEWTVNAMAGPIPITASIALGGSIVLDFKSALRYSELDGYAWASTVDASKVNDYLTTLRINAYIKAFAGVGFDYSVVALKVGVFGKITVDNQNKFLTRKYLADENQRNINGQAVNLTGQAGIEFVAKFLFVSVSYVFASVETGYTWKLNDYDQITNYWNETGSGLMSAPMAKAMASMAGSYGSQRALEAVSSSATLESREYLLEYARSWGEPQRMMTPFSLDVTNKLSSLQTNAYPESRPVVSDDGELLLYLSDQNSTDLTKTRVYQTKLSGGNYPEGSTIADPAGFAGYGDTSHKLSGTGSFAAAAWIRMSDTLPDKYAGDSVTYDEQALLMSAAEIVASVYNGSTWVSTRITNNQTPDLAPVIATNGTDKAIVAWRSVYAGTGDNITDFDVQDQILYKVYSGGSWNDTKVLYNGTSGAVKGIEASMLPDGTAAVVYTLDVGYAGLAADFETAYGIVTASGEPGSSVIITNDEYLDENPQIAAVDFGLGDYRFVLGWHSVQNSVSDIRLAAIDENGIPSNSFIESIRRVAVNVNIDGNFRLASGGEMEDISIIWSEPSESGDDSDSLRSVKLTGDGISAALEVAKLPARTKIEHFSTYSVNAGEVRTVIQAAEYKEIDLGDSSTFNVVTAQISDSETEPVYIPKSETKLFTATAQYQNKAEVQSALPDYSNLAPNNLVAVQFTVKNAGYEKINEVSIKIGTGNPTVFSGLALYPNDSQSLVCYYPVGSVIENETYTITPSFSGSQGAALAGTIYMDYPDIGISKMETVSEDKGLRTVRLTLFNETNIPLAKAERSVVVSFYDDSLLESEFAGKAVTISDMDSLRLIDEGAYAFEVSFDLGAYVTGLGESEIPASGIPFYANAVIKQSAEIMPELYTNNNTKIVLFDSLLIRTGEPVSIFTEQGLSGGNATAEITVRNNSLQSRPSGNIVATLLDNNGVVVETLQSYGDGTVSLDGEESKVVDFTFSQSGSRIVVSYADLDNSNSNANLSSLNFEGLPVRLSDFSEVSSGKYTYSVSAGAVQSTFVSFAAGNPAATVKVNGNPVTGTSNPITLASGETVITVEVTAPDNTTKVTYTLTVSTASSGFVAVTGITSVPTSATAGTPLALSGTVNPSNATNKAITWSVQSAGITGATITGSTLNTTAAGTVTITATIVNGAAVGTPYTQEFTITVNASGSSNPSPGGGGGTATGTKTIGVNGIDIAAVLNSDGTVIIKPTEAEFKKIIEALLNGDILFDTANLTGVTDPAGIILEFNPAWLIDAKVKTLTFELYGTGSVKISSDMLAKLANLNKVLQFKLIKGSLVFDILADGKSIGWYDYENPILVMMPTTDANVVMKNTPRSWVKDWVLYGMVYSTGKYEAVKAAPINFADTVGKWMNPAAQYMSARGVISGIGDNLFAPERNVTRAEFVTMLMGALNIEPQGDWRNTTQQFSDVPEGAFYNDALLKAKSLGIVNGVGENKYNPNATVSRQDMFTMLYNAMVKCGLITPVIDMEEPKWFEGFTDADSISSYARKAMSAFIKEKIVSGKGGGILDPKGTATRGEAAQIIYNMLLRDIK